MHPGIVAEFPNHAPCFYCRATLLDDQISSSAPHWQNNYFFHGALFYKLTAWCTCIMYNYSASFLAL